jgi:hypothetical protein
LLKELNNNPAQFTRIMEILNDIQEKGDPAESQAVNFVEETSALAKQQSRSSSAWNFLYRRSNVNATLTSSQLSQLLEGSF